VIFLEERWVFMSYELATMFVIKVPAHDVPRTGPNARRPSSDRSKNEPTQRKRKVVVCFSSFFAAARLFWVPLE